MKKELKLEETNMKKAIKLTALILSTLCILLFAACGKAEEKTEETPKIITIREREAELGISYDSIVCELRMAPGSPIELHEDFYTNITVYGDNTVQLWTGDYIDGKMSVFQADEPVAITEEQKQKLIEAIRSSTIEILPDDYYDGVEFMYGGSRDILLYDADGNRVHYDKLEGDPLINVDVSEVKNILYDMFLYEERCDIQERTYELNFKFGQGVSFKEKIFSSINQSITGELWTEFTVYADNTVEVRGRTSFQRRYDLFSEVEPITFKITDEETEMLKNCILTEMRNPLDDETLWNDYFYIDCDEEYVDRYRTVIQYYDANGKETFFCTDEYEVKPLDELFVLEILGVDEYIRYTAEIRNMYLEMQGKNISFEDVWCHYTGEPFAKNKKGERIAVKLTVSAETGNLKMAVGPVSDVKGERDIVSKEYTPEEYWAWGAWSDYVWTACEYEMNKSQPNYKKIGAHYAYFDKDGNLTGYISSDSENGADIVGWMEETVIYGTMKEDMENMKAEAKKLMK